MTRNRRTKRWQYYDLAFGPVNTETLDLCEAIFRQNARRPVRDIVELGCGTGRWLTALGQRGYRMTGVDVDDDALTLAQEKCRAAGLRVKLVKQDLAHWDADELYDAVIAPNNTLKWLPSHHLLRKCIIHAAWALRRGGIMILDLTFDEKNWRSRRWGTEEELRERAWVSGFTGPNLSGEYRCFYGTPDLHEGRVPFVERFLCHAEGEDMIIEERTAWLLFSSTECIHWLSETSLLENIRCYDRRAHNPTEVDLSSLKNKGGQCLLVARRNRQTSHSLTKS